MTGSDKRLDQAGGGGTDRGICDAHQRQLPAPRLVSRSPPGHSRSVRRRGAWRVRRGRAVCSCGGLAGFPGGASRMPGSRRTRQGRSLRDGAATSRSTHRLEARATCSSCGHVRAGRRTCPTSCRRRRRRARSRWSPRSRPSRPTTSGVATASTTAPTATGGAGRSASTGPTGRGRCQRLPHGRGAGGRPRGELGIPLSYFTNVDLDHDPGARRRPRLRVPGPRRVLDPDDARARHRRPATPAPTSPSSAPTRCTGGSG